MYKYIILIVLLPIVLVGKDIIDYSKFAIYHENLPRIYKKDYKCDVVKTEDSIECLIINLDKICRNPEKYKINDCGFGENNNILYLDALDDFLRVSIYKDGKRIDKGKDNRLSEIYNSAKYYQIAEISSKVEDRNNKQISIGIRLDDSIAQSDYLFIYIEEIAFKKYRIYGVLAVAELSDFES